MLFTTKIEEISDSTYLKKKIIPGSFRSCFTFSLSPRMQAVCNGVSPNNSNTYNKYAQTSDISTDNHDRGVQMPISNQDKWFKKYYKQDVQVHDQTT